MWLFLLSNHRQDDTRPVGMEVRACSHEQPDIRKTKTYRFVALKRARIKSRRSVYRHNSTSNLLFGTTEEISMRRRVET